MIIKLGRYYHYSNSTNLKDSIKIVYGSTKEGDYRGHIYWELNWLHQTDPKLIQFIKNHVLIPPPSSYDLNATYRRKYAIKDLHHTGMNGEVIAAKILLGFKQSRYYLLTLAT